MEIWNFTTEITETLRSGTEDTEVRLTAIINSLKNSFFPVFFFFVPLCENLRELCGLFYEATKARRRNVFFSAHTSAGTAVIFSNLKQKKLRWFPNGV